MGKPSPPRQGYLLANLVKSPASSDTILLSLWLKGCEQPNNSTAVSSPCTQRQILNHQKLSCGSLSNELKRTTRATRCSISTPFQCGEHETCRQINQSNDGECVCLRDYARHNTTGMCVLVPPEDATTIGSDDMNSTTTEAPAPNKDRKLASSFYSLKVYP